MIMLGFIAFFVCLILLYLALLLKESRDTVKESREVLRSGKESILRIGKIIEELESTVNIAKGTVEEVSDKVLNPIRTISGLVSMIGGFASEKREKKDLEEIEEAEVSIEDLLND